MYHIHDKVINYKVLKKIKLKNESLFEAVVNGFCCLFNMSDRKHMIKD